MSAIIARDQVHEPLYAIVPYFNPWRWKSRVKHTERALKHFHDSGVVIVLVEIGFNRRDLIFADSGLDQKMADCGISDRRYQHKYIGLHTKDELWLKENAINLGIQSLPWDWQNVCWLDSDVHFVRPNWAGECVHKLQHGGENDTAFLQMFSQARDLGPNYEMLPESYPHANGVSFIQSWRDGDLEANLGNWKKKTAKVVPSPQVLTDLAKVEADVSALSSDLVKLAQDLTGYDQARRVFPGLAWAATRRAMDSVGGLIDYAVWGGADWHMAHALIGRRQGMQHSGLHPHYKAMTDAWADKADRRIRQNLLVMEGAIFHHWHGRKTVRGYGDKHRILAKIGFDPIQHLKRDSQGLWQLHDDGSETYIQLRDAFRKIAKERNEDSIDT